MLPLQPSLNYTAPELVRNRGSTITSSSDMFSFGCLAYHLAAKKPLLDCHNNVKMVLLLLLSLINHLAPKCTDDLGFCSCLNLELYCTSYCLSVKKKIQYCPLSYTVVSSVVSRNGWFPFGVPFISPTKSK